MRRYGWPVVPLDQWHCTMARSANYGLPLSLGHAARVAGVDHQKDEAGHRLMMQMCKPRSIDARGNPTWWDVPDNRTFR
jgi:DNA polymerase